ncbi:hypothetical protein [Absidia glauca]|uniref:Uncharacterized protein n=1 Tax=Absidia glauca TaxID=4829 RepID=A0A168SVZ2_ABSGL|nr:hypothetical protein [Absidia glauca]
MTSKATQEYRLSFITLISQLSEIERKGDELFDKIEKAGSIPYDPSTAQHDFEQLLGSLQQLESHARACGLLSISGAGPLGDSQTQPARNLETRTGETLKMVDMFYQEKNRLLMNIRAAATAAGSTGAVATGGSTGTSTGPS